MFIAKHWQILAFFPVMLSSGCTATLTGDAGDDDWAEASEAVVGPNGVSLNGVSLNGVSLNGVSLSGLDLVGASVNNATLNGSVLQGVSASAITINGAKVNALSALGPNGHRIGGASLVGTIFVGTLSNGGTLPLRLDAATVGAPPNEDVYIYGVSYQTQTGWLPLCGVDPTGAPILAVTVQGVWNYGAHVAGGGSYTNDPSQFTFGCRKTAIAKCIEMGYKPWKTLPSGTGTFQDHHVACTRMIRADYCGDGYSWTVNGTPINIYDGVGVQLDTESWALEAEWTPNGAACLGPSARRYTLRTDGVPSCEPSLESESCGDLSHFDAGTRLMNEY